MMPEEVLYDEDDWLPNAEGAKLSYQSRQDLPDSAFCLVMMKDGKKMRKFPAHDAAHVRNALARLPQADLPSAERARAFSCLKRRAGKMGIQVSKAKAAKGEHLVVPQALEGDVPEDGLFWTVGTKIGGAAYAENGKQVYFGDSLAKLYQGWIGKPFFINHEKEGEKAIKGAIEKMIYAAPYAYFGVNITDPEIKAQADKIGATSVDVDNIILTEEGEMLFFEPAGISGLINKEPACNDKDGKKDCGLTIEKLSAEAAHKHAKAVAEWVMHLRDMREALHKDAEKIMVDSPGVAQAYIDLAMIATTYEDRLKYAVGEAYLLEAEGGKTMGEKCDAEKKAEGAEAPASTPPVCEHEAIIAKLKEETTAKDKELEVFKAEKAATAKATSDAERAKLVETLKSIGRDPTKYESLDNKALGLVVEEMKAVAARPEPKEGVKAAAEKTFEDGYKEYQEWCKKRGFQISK